MNTHYNKQLTVDAMLAAEESAAKKAADEKAFAEKKRQEELEAFNQEQEAIFNKVFRIVRAVFSNLANIADIVNRYAGVTGILAIGVNIASMFPAAVLGPIAAMIHLILSVASESSLANKLINIFTTSGSAGTSLAAIIIHSIALPLIIVSSSLNFIRESWELGNVLYKKHYLKDGSVTPTQYFDAWAGFILAALSLAGAIMLMTPAAPASFVIFGLIGAYRLADSLGYNPFKKILGYYNTEEEVTTPIAVEDSTVKMQVTLATAPTVKVDVNSEVTEKVEVEAPATPKPMKIKSRFQPGFYSYDDEKPMRTEGVSLEDNVPKVVSVQA